MTKDIHIKKHAILGLLSQPAIQVIRLMHPIMCIWRRFYFTARLSADVKDIDFSIQCDGRVHITGTRNIRLGKRCRLGMETELRTIEKGRIRLGADVRVNRCCTLTSYSGIFIDDFTIIGEFVSIRDANHGMKQGKPMRYQPHTSSPIRIGRDVWIGRGSCVLPGVTIGDGVVIGANSVVSRDISSYSIAAGAPAKVIKKRE